MEELREAAAAAPDAIAVDLLEADDAFRLIVDIPGATAGETDVRLADRTVHIRAGRSQSLPEGAVDRQLERPAVLECDLPLPAGVDADEASASIERGVLEIVLPKSPATTERSIPIEDE